MSKVPLILLLVLVAAIVGGGVFLATWDIPPPSKQIEKLIPDDKFPR